MSKINDKHEEVLSSTVFAAMSTLRHTDGRISTNPVSFLWNGEEFEVSTLKSRMKYKNLVARPTVTLCVVSPTNPMAYVEVRGTARLVDDPDRELFRAIFRKISGNEAPEDLDPPGAERVMVYITPEQVSSPLMYGGRFEQ